MSCGCARHVKPVLASPGREPHSQCRQHRQGGNFCPHLAGRLQRLAGAGGHRNPINNRALPRRGSERSRCSLCGHVKAPVALVPIKRGRTERWTPSPPVQVSAPGLGWTSGPPAACPRRAVRVQLYWPLAARPLGRATAPPAATACALQCRPVPYGGSLLPREGGRPRLRASQARLQATISLRWGVQLQAAAPPTTSTVWPRPAPRRHLYGAAETRRSLSSRRRHGPIGTAQVQQAATGLRDRDRRQQWLSAPPQRTTLRRYTTLLKVCARRRRGSLRNGRQRPRLPLHRTRRR